MSHPVTSVIIPSYNRAYCLSNALDSLVGQTFADWEALVIDDGSTDGTGELIAERYGRDPRIRYIYQENRGVSAARNRGLAAATGDFVSYLDSDDVWEPWKLELQMACFGRHPNLGMVWSDMKAVDASGAVVSPAYLRIMYTGYDWFETPDDLFDSSEDLAQILPCAGQLFPGRRFYWGDIFAKMAMGSLVHASTVVIRREVADNAGLFREDWRFTGEDFHYHWRICREAPVGFIDAPSILYRVGNEDQLTKPEYNVHCAQAFLLTLHEFLKRDRHRIRLPERMINSSLAHAHLWLGEELMLAGERRRGRAHFAKSLQHSASARALYRLAVSSMPHEFHRLLKSMYQRLRHAEHVSCLAAICLDSDLLESLASAGELLI